MKFFKVPSLAQRKYDDALFRALVKEYHVITSKSLGAKIGIQIIALSIIRSFAS